MSHHKKSWTQWGAVLLTSGFLWSAAMTAQAAPSQIHSTAAVPAEQQTFSMKDFGKMKRMLKKLNLSNEQKVEIDQLMQVSTPQANKLHEEMRGNMIKIKKLSYSTTYNEKEISTLAKHQGDLLSQMIVLRAKLNSDIYRILTPEQQAQLRTTMEEKMARKAAQQK